MTDYGYWECEKARSVADKFAVESIKKVTRYRDWIFHINKLAAKVLGVARREQSWGQTILRPIAFGAPEYKIFLRRPAIIEENYDEKKTWLRKLYIFQSEKIIEFLGYGRRPFFLLSNRYEEPRRSGGRVEMYPALESAGLWSGILYRPSDHHAQRVFSFAAFYLLAIHKVYRHDVEYIVPLPRKEGDRQVYAVLGNTSDGAYIRSEVDLEDGPVLPLYKSAAYDEYMIYMRLLFTPCELYDALKLLSEEFTPLIYESTRHGGLIVIDRYYLENVLKRRGVRAVRVILIEPNNPDRAEENAELITVNTLTLDLSEIPTEDAMTLDEIYSPKALYDAAVLARLG